jgi:hypothetical protein
MKARAYALNSKHGLPVDNKVRDEIIVELRQGEDGLAPMDEEDIARLMGISRRRVAQVLINLLGANNFISDKNKVRQAIRLFLQGMSHRKIAEKFTMEGTHVTQPTISSVVRDYLKREDLIAEHTKAHPHLKSVVDTFCLPFRLLICKPGDSIPFTLPRVTPSEYRTISSGLLHPLS